jgi:hypothetical protein
LHRGRFGRAKFRYKSGAEKLCDRPPGSACRQLLDKKCDHLTVLDHLGLELLSQLPHPPLGLNGSALGVLGSTFGAIGAVAFHG